MDGWKTSFLLGWHTFRGELLVSGNVTGFQQISRVDWVYNKKPAGVGTGINWKNRMLLRVKQGVALWRTSEDGTWASAMRVLFLNSSLDFWSYPI